MKLGTYKLLKINKLNIKIVISLIILLNCQTNYSQQDTLINYNTVTHQIFYYSPVPIDTIKNFEQSGWNYGNYPGRDFYNLEPPDSTYNNSGFTDFTPLQYLYNTNNYPSRTAVKLYQSKNDTFFQLCSGILVAPDYVLTGCHCVGGFDTNRVLIFRDSIWVFPAYDNGNENPIFGKSIGVEYITFKSNLSDWYFTDIALIKLADNIGLMTGWVGIAYQNEDDYFLNNVLHKTSYPMIPDYCDTTRIFNGDTLYYNYGILDLVDENWLGYDICGVKGQSGSSLIFTDNMSYYSFGTLVWSAQSKHKRITPEIYYPFKEVILSDLSSIDAEKYSIQEFYLSNAYPNPFNSSTKFVYRMPIQSSVQIKVFDILGREVALLVHKDQKEGQYEILFNAGDLPSGIYFCRMQSKNYVSTKKIILLK